MRHDLAATITALLWALACDPTGAPIVVDAGPDGTFAWAPPSTTAPKLGAGLPIPTPPLDGGYALCSVAGGGTPAWCGGSTLAGVQAALPDGGIGCLWYLSDAGAVCLPIGSDGQELTIVSGLPAWANEDSGTGLVFYGADLAGSTSTAQWVAAISGPSGDGGTVTVASGTLQWISGVGPVLQQANPSSDITPANFLIEGQNAYVDASVHLSGGDVRLVTGTAADGGSAGQVGLIFGGPSSTSRITCGPGGTETWSGNLSPLITQAPAASAQDFTIQAADTTTSGANGGNLVLSGGTNGFGVNNVVGAQVQTATPLVIQTGDFNVYHLRVQLSTGATWIFQSPAVGVSTCEDFITNVVCMATNVNPFDVYRADFEGTACNEVTDAAAPALTWIDAAPTAQNVRSVGNGASWSATIATDGGAWVLSATAPDAGCVVDVTQTLAN